MLVVLRVTLRQYLAASGRQRLDLGCASAATAVNVGLNFLLIPSYGIIGAALATLVSEAICRLLFIKAGTSANVTNPTGPSSGGWRGDGGLLHRDRWLTLAASAARCRSSLSGNLACSWR
jgi:Na+-driven multidrug efflux pump